jgi:hypothetical protein
MLDGVIPQSEYEKYLKIGTCEAGQTMRVRASACPA